MRLSYESIIAPENGTSGVPFDDQALLSGITVDATKVNMLDGITGNVQSRLNDAVSTGGTLTGNVTLNGMPSVDLHAASKAYADGVTVSGKLSTAGGTMTGALTLSGVATAPLGAITKQQMDDSITAAVGSGGGGSLIENWPRWDTNPSEQVGLGWTSFQSKLNAIIAEVRKAPLASYAKVTAGGSYPGTSESFHCGVLLPDGRVFVVPANSTTARIYDPVTDTVSIPAGTYPGADAFGNGILLPDGRVFLVPRGSTTARIYDPVTDALSTPAGVYPGGGYFKTSVLLKDGRVLMIATAGNTGGSKIYDPATNTVSTPTLNLATLFGIMNVRGNALLLPDGRVMIITYSATVVTNGIGTKACIYDPATDTTSAEIIIDSTTLSGFSHSVLLPDGRVFIVPSYSTTARIIDPDTLTITTPSGTYPGVQFGFSGGVLLPDGRVYCVPYASTTARIYDPVTDTLTTPAGTFTSYTIRNAVMLPDGRIYLIPSGVATTYLLAANVSNLQGNKKLPNNMTLSPYYRKSNTYT